MPELPEVQTTVNGLNRTVKNLTIDDVWSDYYLRTADKRKDTIKNKKYFENLRKEIVGEKIIGAERRGKNVLINLTHDKTILVHMKMTGHFLYGKYALEKGVWSSKEKFLSDPFNKFVHLLFELSNNKQLAFSDMRKFAKVILFKTSKIDSVADLRQLGPEPVPNLPLKTFKNRLLLKPEGQIKTTLMNQGIIVGIGNIYSDEILWTAGIHPERKISSLKDKEIENIWKATKKILVSSTKIGGDSMSDYRNIHGEKGGFQDMHKAYRRTKERCPKSGCRGIITRKVIAGRSSHFCNIHQK